MRPAFDPDGHYMILVSDDYAAKALARGEAVESEQGHLVVVPQPMNELDGETKRRLRLKKERML
jgi:hypothetical protein